MKFKYILLTCILITLVTACARPPVAEMEEAREAVFRAENDADAVIYGANPLARARDALRRMQIEADAKRYDAAKTLAAEAIAAAERAIADGKTGASRVGAEASSIIAGLRQEIDETSRNVSGARYSMLNLDYNTLEREISGAYAAADQAELDQNAGRHQAALDKAMNIRATLSNINQMVANAVTRKK